MGMLDIAEENFDDKARVKDCIAKMRGAASHLLSLVNDVLDMSKNRVRQYADAQHPV